MPNAETIPCAASFARVDVLVETLGTLRVLAGCYASEPENGRHIEGYLRAALAGCLEDLAEGREPMTVA